MRSNFCQDYWIVFDLVEINPCKRVSLRVPVVFAGGIRLRTWLVVQAPFRSNRVRIPTLMALNVGAVVGVVIVHSPFDSFRGVSNSVYWVSACISIQGFTLGGEKRMILREVPSHLEVVPLL